MNDPVQPSRSDEIEDFRRRFTRPPLVGRHFVTFMDVPRERFESVAPKLVERIQEERGFKQPTLRNHWEFNIETRPGGVVVPKGKLTHILRLVREKSADHSDAVMELVPPRDNRPAEFSVSHSRSDDNPSRFEALRSECQAVLPVVLDLLGLSEVKGVFLKYTNEIGRNRYPKLWSESDSLVLADLFRIFGGPSAPHTFLTPLHVEFKEKAKHPKEWAVNPGRDATVHFLAKTHVKAPSKEFDFKAVLTYSSLENKPAYALKTLWEYLEVAHRLVLESFGEYFADKALREFCS